jgi:pantothenate kinase
MMLISPDGTHNFVGISSFGGGALVGLGRAMTGISTYSEMVKLAQEGNRKNIDTSFGEALEGDSYPGFPEEFVVFSFGKMANFRNEIDSFEKKDILASLFANMGSQIRVTVKEAMSRVNANEIYLSGGTL